MHESSEPPGQPEGGAGEGGGGAGVGGAGVGVEPPPHHMALPPELQGPMHSASEAHLSVTQMPHLEQSPWQLCPQPVHVPAGAGVGAAGAGVGAPGFVVEPIGPLLMLEYLTVALG